MATLLLNLLKYGLDGPVMNAAVVSVRQVSDSGDRLPDDPFEAQVPIPAGPTPPARIEVPEGRYALTARAPSGETDRRNVRVESGEPAEVTFDIGHSQHEWLSWSTLSGAMPSRDRVEARPKRRVDPRFVDLARFELFSGRSPPIFADGGVGTFQIRSGRAGLNYLNPNYLDAPPLHLTSLGADRAAFAWRITEPSRHAGVEERRGRPFVRVRHDGGTTYAVLPLPWALPYGTPVERDVDPAEPTAVVDLVLDHGAPPSRAIRTVLREPEFVALLGYLGAGRMQEAAAALGGTIDAHVTRLIREKIDNPLAAAGAAYVGLATTGDEDLRRLWSPWLRNLMNWFEDLPDGAILYARDRIERGRTPEDLEDAKAALRVAYRRGLPLYSAGFRHLLSGLQLFSDDAESPHFDPEMPDMYRQVAAKAALADPTQPFTVLTFPDR